MIKKALSFFSYIFHPLFIPFFGTLLYFFFATNYFTFLQKELVVLQIAIITIFIPIAFYFLLKTLNKVDSIMVSNISQRKLPLLIQAILLLMLLNRGITEDRIPELYYYLLGGFISALTAFVFLYFKSKISIHMIGISALTSFAIALSIHNQINIIYFISILVLCNGLVATSRLVMNAHTPKELIIGFFSGIVPQVMLWQYWL